MTAGKNVAVIGGGPCGLMAAERLSDRGFKVSVYDHMPSVGRKLLMAGRGGLNLTHSEPLALLRERYGAAESWLTPALDAFPPTALREWCEALGQETFIGSSGRVFPRAMKAAPLLRAWLARLRRSGVRFMLRHRWLGWQEGALRFRDAAGSPIVIRPDATLLALGGASWPRLGSDGGWFSILEASGITLAPLRPANCGFAIAWSTYFTERFAGWPLKPVALRYRGETCRGELTITGQGLEGGALYAFSARLREALAEQDTVRVLLDLRPDIPSERLIRRLSVPRGSRSLSSHLRRLGFSPLVVGLLRETVPGEALKGASPDALTGLIKSLPLTLTATTGLARAISTAGGIQRGAVNDHFMLLDRPGVFAAGEMLDWEAPTGGYLLQACLSTAVAAADGIAAYCAAG